MLIMFDFQKKNQFDFGNISINDDRDIEVYRVRQVSGKGLWTESVKAFTRYYFNYCGFHTPRSFRRTTRRRRRNFDAAAAPRRRTSACQ